MRPFLLALLAFAFTADALAQHNARYRPKGDPVVTEVSGAGTPSGVPYPLNVTLDDFGADFLHAITLWDGPGGPCAVTATGWKARGGFPSGIDTSWIRERRLETETRRIAGVDRTLVECTVGRDERRAEAAFPSPPRPAPTQPRPTVTFRGHYGAAGISGLRVCTDGTPSSRVLGLSIYTSTVNEGGNGRVERSGTETVEFDGCTEWQPARHCPKGQIATGLDLYHRGRRGEPDYLAGMALHCAAVRIRPVD